MIYFGVLLMLIGCVQGSCEGRRPIKPVCGSNGRIYYNECDIKDNNGISSKPLYPVDWNECANAECQLLCTRELNPVCASDGEIADNPCVFLNYDVCEKKKYLYEVDMEFCLAKKCPHNCASNDEKCERDYRNCRFLWTGEIP